MSPHPPSLTAERLLAYLAEPEAARRWLASLGVRDPERGARDLRDIAGRDRPIGPLVALANQVQATLPTCPDPDMALTNLERFVSASDDPELTLTVLALTPKTTEIAIQLFSTSQYFSELMIRDPTLLGWLRSRPDRRDRDDLIADLWDELREADDEGRRRAIRRFRQREMLRIGYDDIVRGSPLEVTTLDLSHLADACVEGAVRVARVNAEGRHGIPRRSDGRPARFVVLALGKLGGEELNYSSDIDLIFVYDEEGRTDGPRPLDHAEFFARMGGEVVRLLSDFSALGQAYRVDMRLRPEGDQGPLARSLASTLGYYETSGRTWERQALIKARAVAGDLGLGHAFLGAIAPFVHRRYLGGAEINEIKAMKRRIEERTVSAKADEVEVKTGRGGIRDVEFVVQFLQLLHGGRYPEVRTGNTLLGLSRLEQLGCLTSEEHSIMEDTYRFLRRVEHRLQTMFDRQTHQMPRDPEELRTLAIRLGYPPASPWEDRPGPAQRFLADYRSKTDLNRRILNHLLHDAFLDDGPEAQADPVVDLVLDPDPTPERVAAALAAYPFRDRPTAHANLLALAREDIPFLSQARCRHFLAAIAPRLLQALGRTPDPDLALTNLEKVSASLGAKAILWELFNFNPPTLRLFVELCASSQFLCEVLVNNPGMIDDLMDSLVVDRPQSGKAIAAELAELCRGAEDLQPILLGFRNKEWVRIGTRDILGREPIREVTRELADVAEAIVAQVARDRWDRLAERFGPPRRESDGGRAGWAILGLGKLGGRELNYHGDLDLVFVHEADGSTRGGPEGVIPNAQFFDEVARRVLKALAGAPGTSPIYAADARLRPHGASGPLVVGLDPLRDYFRDKARPWERLAWTRARVVSSRGDFGRKVVQAIHEALAQPAEPTALAREVVAIRRRLEISRAPGNLKRGAGGIADVEFLIQYLQLAHAAERPEVLRPNAWEAIAALRRAGLIDPQSHADLLAAYDFLRAVEGRLRIAHNRAVTDWPDQADDLALLARGLGYDAPDREPAIAAFRADAARHAERTRALFRQVVGTAAGLPIP